MTRGIFLIGGLLVFDAGATGLQHGLFRSQATQGPVWVGTAEIVAERYVMTVHPDFLEVELDWEIGVGGTRPAQHEKALEIVGNINLEPMSSVTGMLVWYKHMVLKGKLKTTAHARKDYEEVVDRGVTIPPVPKDPVLLEWIRQDNYDISIFPVEWGSTRKVRLRYLVPLRNDVVGYPHAFSDKAVVILKKGKGVKGITLATNKGAFAYSDPVVVLPPGDFEFRAYQWGAPKPNPTHILPMLQDSITSSRMNLGSFAGDGFPGNFSGYMAHFQLKVPRQLLGNEPLPNQAQVHAVLRSGTETCKKAISGQTVAGTSTESFRLFSKSPLVEAITWTLHSGETLVREVMERPTVVRVKNARDYSRSFGGATLYPMAPTLPQSLGVTLGFIDKRYSLVALESDALPLNLVQRYGSGGLPALEPGDVFPDRDENYQVPVETWLRDRYLTRELLLRPTYDFPVTASLGSQLPSGIRFRILNGVLHVEIDPMVLSSGLKLACTVHGADGRLVHAWRKEDLHSGVLTWTPTASRRGSGTYFLKVILGNRHYSQAIRFVE